LNQDQDLFSVAAFHLQGNHLVQVAYPSLVLPFQAVEASPFQVQTMGAYYDLPYQVAFQNSCVVVACLVVGAFLHSYLAVEAYPFPAEEACQAVVVHPLMVVEACQVEEGLP